MGIKLTPVPKTKWYLIDSPESNFMGTLEVHSDGERNPMMKIRNFEGNIIKTERPFGSWNEEYLEKITQSFLRGYLSRC